MKKSALKEHMIFLTSVFVLALPVVLTFYFEDHPERTVSELESTVALIPLGTSAAEADNYFGSQPDSISQMKGVLANPMLLLDASNELAAKQGPIQSYSLRTWKRNDVYATVAIDESGKVAGRWTGVEYKPLNYNWYSLNMVFARLKNCLS